METLAGLFVAVSEHPQPVELRRLDKLAQRIEIRFRFAGKSDNHAGADANTRDRRANPFNEFEENLRASSTLHSLQHGSARVLQRMKRGASAEIFLKLI